MKNKLKLLFIPLAILLIWLNTSVNPSAIPSRESIPLPIYTQYSEVFDAYEQSQKHDDFLFCTSTQQEDQSGKIVYIPDLKDEIYRDKVVERLKQGLEVCFIGTSTIQELESLLNLTLSHCLKVQENHDNLFGYPSLANENIFSIRSVNYKENTILHDFPKDLSFDLLLYRLSGENILVASILSKQKDYKNLLLCLAEETLSHPETYHTSISGNVQYRLYNNVLDNTYFAYDLTLYHDFIRSSNSHGYTYLYNAFFSQNGQSIMTESQFLNPYNDRFYILPIGYYQQGYVNHYPVLINPTLPQKKEFFIPESKVYIEKLEFDGYKMFFEKKSGYYDQETILHPFYSIQLDQSIQEDPLEILDVEFKPVFH